MQSFKRYKAELVLRSGFVLLEFDFFHYSFLSGIRLIRADEPST